MTNSYVHIDEHTLFTSNNFHCNNKSGIYCNSYQIFHQNHIIIVENNFTQINKITFYILLFTVANCSLPRA